MKSIIEYILEGKDKFFRFYFKKFNDDEIVSKIESLAAKNNIYTENIDGGIKIKIKESDIDKADKLVEMINDFINSHQNDENVSDAIDSLSKAVSNMQDYIESFEDGE